jgi:hypothetical protein
MEKGKFVSWVRKVGFWGFLFFLAKGLVWLGLAWWVAR